MSMLRQQRMLGNPSPALSLPPRLDPPGPPKPPRHPLQGLDRRTGDGGAASDGEIEQQTRRQQFDRHERGFQQQQLQAAQQAEQQEQARKQPRRRESHSRRHTLQNGIDYGLVKHD